MNTPKKRPEWTFPAVRCSYCGRGFATMLEYLLHVAAQHNPKRQRPTPKR
jgi:hypothetical protein